MRRAAIAALSCVGILVAWAPSANAFNSEISECVGTADWSISLTTATVNTHDVTCREDWAGATLENGMYPKDSIHGDFGDPSGGAGWTTTFAYQPIVGLCDGTLSAPWIGSGSTTGVLKNDGNFHTSVTLVSSMMENEQAFNIVEQHVGALQNACSSSFTTQVTWVFEGADVNGQV